MTLAERENNIPATEPGGKTVITLENVSKMYRVAHERADSIKERLVNVYRKRQVFTEFWALKNVNLEIREAETFGIIGRNGSGKSTVLKLIAGITKPTTGSLDISGRISALLELGAGFHPDLSGRENIYLNGSIIGLTREQIDERFDDIVRFAELEEFIDTPVKHYSSGMYARLGFSISINIEPEIMLIDEILSVGDEVFQKKCFKKIQNFRNMGHTIVFISHDLDRVFEICDRVAFLHEGEIQFIGTPQKAIYAYQKKMDEEKMASDVTEKMAANFREDKTKRSGTGRVEIEDVRFLNEEKKAGKVFRPGESMEIEICYNAHERVESPTFGITIVREDGQFINDMNTYLDGVAVPAIEGRGSIKMSFEPLRLLEARYFIGAGIFEGTDWANPLDHRRDQFVFKVVPYGELNNGAVMLPHSWIPGEKMTVKEFERTEKSEKNPFT